MRLPSLKRHLVAFTVSLAVLAVPRLYAQDDNEDRNRHVLLISIDGLHAVDLARYVRLHPNSTLAQLTGIGVTFPNASTSRPSDSFPERAFSTTIVMIATF